MGLKFRESKKGSAQRHYHTTRGLVAVGRLQPLWHTTIQPQVLQSVIEGDAWGRCGGEFVTWAKVLADVF